MLVLVFFCFFKFPSIFAICFVKLLFHICLVWPLSHKIFFSSVCWSLAVCSHLWMRHQWVIRILDMWEQLVNLTSLQPVRIFKKYCFRFTMIYPFWELSGRHSAHTYSLSSCTFNIRFPLCLMDSIIETCALLSLQDTNCWEKTLHSPTKVPKMYADLTAS